MSKAIHTFNLMDDAMIRTLATRRKIVDCLQSEPKTKDEICAETDLSAPTVSTQLRHLTALGILATQLHRKAADPYPIRYYGMVKENKNAS